MSRGQKPRVPEYFPHMKYRAAKRHQQATICAQRTVLPRELRKEIWMAAMLAIGAASWEVPADPLAELGQPWVFE